MSGPAARHFASDRLRLHYAEWGDPAAPALILVHGSRDHARNWDWTVAALGAGRRVVAPDLRGHGDSDWSPDGAYALPFHVGDLAALVDTLGEAEVAIVGHSLGGAIALRYAALYPERVRRLAAIEGLGPTPAQLAAQRARPVWERLRAPVDDRRAAAARVPRRYATIDEALARMRAANGFLSDAQARHLTEHGLRRDPEGGWRWKFDPMVRVDAPSDVDEGERQELWGHIACPVWLVHGAESWASHPGGDGRAAHFRDARVTSYEGAGHWVHHDRLDAFADGLRAFLA